MKINKCIAGNTYIIDLPQNNGYCLSGRHHCTVIKQIGSTAIVVPITTYRDNLHYGEIEMESNSITKYKIKVGQLTSVSLDRFIAHKGKTDKKNLQNIGNFIQNDIVDFILRKIV